MNGELVMGGILEGDCKDRMADRLHQDWWDSERELLRSAPRKPPEFAEI